MKLSPFEKKVRKAQRDAARREVRLDRQAQTLDAAAQQHSSTANGDLRLLSAYVIRAKHKANAFPMQFGRSTPRACARPPPGRTMEEQQL